jgi:hypothetical protein
MDTNLSNQNSLSPREQMIKYLEGGAKVVGLALMLGGCQHGSITDSINKPAESVQQQKVAEVKKPNLPPPINNAEVTKYGVKDPETGKYEAGTGHYTATGEKFNPQTDKTAATAFGAPRSEDPQGVKTEYPLDTIVRITNPQNGKFTDVRINDKGNFGKYGDFNPNTTLDVTPAVARAIGISETGITRGLRIEFISVPPTK